jgi:hypothetical protein
MIGVGRTNPILSISIVAELVGQIANLNIQTIGKVTKC